MSYRDRSERDETPPADDAPDAAPRRVNRPLPSTSRPVGPRRAAPQRTPVNWEEDPAEVDRYLDERARAAPPSRRQVPTRPAGQPAGRGGAAATRQTAPPPAGSRSTPRPAPAGLGDPTDPTQWDEDATGPWVDPALDDHDRLDDDPVPATGPLPTRRAAAPPAAGRARPRIAGPTTRPLPNLRNVRVPTFISGSELARDHAALWLLGIAAFGLGVMAALLSNQLGGLDPGVGIHVDAAGRTDRWGDPNGLWRLPLLATMLTLMNATAAWFLIRSDRFAARFLLAAAIVVQIVTWVAVVDFL